MDIKKQHIDTEIPELTKLELSILKQGKQLVSDEQYAVCYMTAKCQMKNKTPQFGAHNKNLAAECGMNPETFRRLVEKFSMLFDGRSEDPYFEKFYMYKKLYKHFDDFVEMRDETVYDLAERSFTEENRTIGYELALEKAEQQNKYAEEYKRKDHEIKTKVTMLFNTLNGVFKDAPKAKRQAINKIACECNVSAERVQGVWERDAMLKKIC